MPLLSLEPTPPRLVLLDTAHLIGWFADRASDQAGDRQRAAAFETRLARGNWLPLLTWHHFEELLQHRNTLVAKRRIRALHSLPRLAWIESLGSGGLGGVVDIMAAEALVACRLPSADLKAITDNARKLLLRTGSGQDLLGDNALKWLAFQPLVQAREGRTREIVAINQSDFAGIGQTKISTLLNGARETDPARVTARLAGLSQRLSAEITARGDRRIGNADTVAQQLMAEASAMADEAPGTARDLVLQTLFNREIEPGDIGPDTVLDDLTDLIVFRLQLKTVSEKLAVPWPVVKANVPMARAPSYRIGRALDTHGQALPEHKGSELNDNYLLRAGAYADLAYVDKRTLENLWRARRKEPWLDGLLGEIARAATYQDILLAPERYPTSLA